MRDTALRAVHEDAVYVVESNILFENRLPPYQPFPYVTYNTDNSEGKTVPKDYYAKFTTIDEAVEWIESNGYQRTSVYLQEATHSSESSENAKKTIPVKFIPSANTYSVVCLFVDFGDKDIHQIPFRYKAGAKSWDLSGLKMASNHVEANFPLLKWLSTDAHNSRMYGGNNRTNMLSSEQIASYANRIANRPRP